MENQHRRIKGYRELNQREIDLMNEIKVKAAEVGKMVEELEGKGLSAASVASIGYDQRWVSEGKMDLQKGFMALTRAVTLPEFF